MKNYLALVCILFLATTVIVQAEPDDFGLKRTEPDTETSIVATSEALNY